MQKLRSCLHADDSVDEKEHDNEQGDVWQGLERFDKRPKQRSDAFASAQQLHQSHHTKQAEEVDGNEVCARLKEGNQISNIVFPKWNIKSR